MTVTEDQMFTPASYAPELAPESEARGAVWKLLTALAAAAVVVIGATFGILHLTGSKPGSATTIPSSGAAAATGVPASAAGAASPLSGYVCSGTESYLFNNWPKNGPAVGNYGTSPTFSTDGKAFCFVAMATYHWNNGLGAPAGKIGLELVSGDGSSVPPTQAEATAGQAPGVNWVYSLPNGEKPVVLDGTYSCTDSSPATWSQANNPQATSPQDSGLGFCWVQVTPAVKGSS